MFSEGESGIVDGKLPASSIDPALRGKADEILRLLKSGKMCVTVAGPAGCGKTELIKYIRRGGGDGSSAHVMTFTNQAALMLRQRGLEDATTIHSTIYYPMDGKLDEIKNTRLARDRLTKLGGHNQEIARLNEKLDRLMKPGYVLNEESALRITSFCIIDEASMVGKALGRSIDHFGCPVVAFGDQFQLGPVEDKPHFDLENADITLTKIFRQDADSDILAFATCIREERCDEFRPSGREFVGRRFYKMNNDDIRKWMVEADQILCATNNTRRALNRRMLTYLGFDESRFPKGRDEEKLICLAGYPHRGLLNGSFVRVRNVKFSKEADRFFTANIERDVGGGKWEACGEARIWKGAFEHTHDGVSEQKAKELRRDDTSAAIAYKDHDELGVWLDWAWAVTTHKAQGNEWDKVLLITEWWPTKKEPHLRMRMHYTGVTRARKQLRMIAQWGERPNRA